MNNSASAGIVAGHVRNRVELLGDTVHVAELDVRIADAAEYLRQIPAEKREVALVHVIRVGIAEIAARRKRFGDRRQRTLPPDVVSPNVTAKAMLEEEEPTRPLTDSIPLATRTEATRDARVEPVERVAELRPERQSEAPTTRRESDEWLKRLDIELEVKSQPGPILGT